ncbi:MAG: hypothetical protein QMC98_01500 [Candidatus Thermoplasmatota archaeon]|nr:hypothetical protein [Candidatus Thermoplasmatota archaeon]
MSIPTTATAVGFLFDSDTSVYSYEGAYIDEVVLKATKTLSAKSIGAGDPTLTLGRYQLEPRTDFPSQEQYNNPESADLLSVAEDNIYLLKTAH